MPRFHIPARDVPEATAARRLGMTVAAFVEALPNLVARGFPKRDPDTGNFDLSAIDRWCDSRHPHLFGAVAGLGARDAGTCVADRLRAARG